MILRFDGEAHEYFLGDRKLESVTQVLELSGMQVYPNTLQMEEARVRGTFVHQATRMIDQGTLDWDNLDPILFPYCKAYQAFLREIIPEDFLVTEKPMCHPSYLYAGTPDRILKINGLRSLLDIKTGIPHPATPVQVAAYCELAKVSEGMHFLKGFSLHLRVDGSYRLKEITDLSRNFQIFLAALSVVRWRKENL